MEIKLKVDQWDIQLELTFSVDKSKFTEEFAKTINEFWGNSEDRKCECGSHFKAALKLYAQECFQQVAFNNFKHEKWVTEQFDWNKEKGIEGFADFETAGLKLIDIESWFIEFENVEFA